MATLGSSSWAPAGPCESGSNAFDFDGRLDEAIKAFTASHGRRPTYQEFKDALDPLEAKFDVGQISPRVFECASSARAERKLRSSPGVLPGARG
jgi:hypothetical protein